MVLAVDVQTLPGPHWQMTWDEPSFESLCIAAASLTRELLDAGASVGLAAASFAGSPQRFAWLPPQASLSQLPRAGQLLARIGPVSSGPLSALLSWLPHRVTPGSGIVLLTSRDPSEHLAALRRLARIGYRRRAAGRSARMRTSTRGPPALAGLPASVRPGASHAGRIRMRSPWPARVLLPAAQALAEGSWLAVVYAALQAATGQFPWIGPLEFGVMAGAGMAWGRRRRWRSPTAEALGLPLLALAAGAFGWLLDPVVRGDLAVGQPIAALSLHGAGWLGAIAFWRGEVHRSTEDDDVIQDRLLRWVAARPGHPVAGRPRDAARAPSRRPSPRPRSWAPSSSSAPPSRPWACPGWRRCAW